MGFLTLVLLVLTALAFLTTAQDNNFNTYYYPKWGQNHITINPQGTEAQLLIDQSSGAGFRSKAGYGSGLFHIKMKIPNQSTNGILTTFYLSSVPGDEAAGVNHFELDMEFIGTGNLGIMSTNIFNNDTGNREQKFNLWFDPSQDFHSYDILWNPYQITFFIDNIPIRVFKNNTAKGLVYPSQPLHIEASIWQAPWAGQVNWSLGPFISHYSDFSFKACPVPDGISDVSGCASQQNPWNQPQFWELTQIQKQQFHEYRTKFMVYDYCTRFPDKQLECSLNNVAAT